MIDRDILLNIKKWILPKLDEHPLRKKGDSYNVYYTVQGEQVKAEDHLNLKVDTTYFGK